MERRDPQEIAATVLRLFADLARSAGPAPAPPIDPRLVAWVHGDAAVGFTDQRRPLPIGTRPEHRDVLAAARVRGDAAQLRLGLVWLVDEGTLRAPLVSVPVGLGTMTRLLVGGAGQWTADGEPELWDPDLPDHERQRWLDRLDDVDWFHEVLVQHLVADELDDIAELRTLARDFAAAHRVTTAPLRTAGHSPRELVEGGGDVLVAACAVYVQDVRSRPITDSTTFHAWSDRVLHDTALAALYAPRPSHDGAADEPIVPVLPPVLLDRGQRDAVAAVRAGAPVTVISGPPGTGKSQTVVAIAHDAIAHGEHVLVAAPSDAAVRAIADLMVRAGGPTPVVFGGADGERAALAAQLADGTPAPNTSVVALDDVEATLRTAIGRCRDLRQAVEERLAVEASLGALGDADELVARQRAPGFFDTDTDHGLAGELAGIAGSGRGWWSRRKARRATRRLRAMGRSDDAVGLADLTSALDVARRRRLAAGSRAGGGLTLDEVWPALLAADAEARDASATWLARWSTHPERSRRGSREAVSVVAAALRSGRRRRRELLASVPGERLTGALPIWVATLNDIEDLLPASPGMFDLVIVDEAAQVDQPTASVALARARRAVVVGDPRQLRHVSFLSDERVGRSLAAHGLDADPLLAGRLDLRRMTLFDAAASIAPVHVLDVHHRSAPHLIGFSARTFYDGRLTVATAHPGNDGDDRIDVVAVTGRRVDDVNRVEVDWVIDRLRRAAAEGERSVGVITPFRAQADAIEQAVTAALSLEELDALDLRIGTVHGFQGCERDHVLVSLAAHDRGPLSFVNDRNLFNVMVTRARERATVVTSLGDRATGLVADYLTYAERGPALPRTGSATGWTATVAAELRRAGLPVTEHYPFGTSTVDLVVGRDDDAIGVICSVHPDGPAAHVDRHLALLRRGWRLRDVFASRWDERLAEVAVRFAVAFGPSGPDAGV